MKKANRKFLVCIFVPHLLSLISHKAYKLNNIVFTLGITVMIFAGAVAFWERNNFPPQSTECCVFHIPRRRKMKISNNTREKAKNFNLLSKQALSTIGTKRKRFVQEMVLKITSSVKSFLFFRPKTFLLLVLVSLKLSKKVCISWKGWENEHIEARGREIIGRLGEIFRAFVRNLMENFNRKCSSFPFDYFESMSIIKNILWI